jgi:large subunit ribosomal protein L7Ae
LFKLLVKYSPETKAAKTLRLEELAKAKAAGTPATQTGPAPSVLKFGLKHITTLVEQKKASLVLIAHDVDPIELVVWLPALCRKMDIPYAIVKGKSRLGTLVHKKNCAVVALTSVNAEDKVQLGKLQENFKTQFNNNVVRKWGGGKMGLKTEAKLEKRRKQVEAEQKKIQAALR